MQKEKVKKFLIWKVSNKIVMCKGECYMNIAVCCSSSNDISRKYLESSKRLLQLIFKSNNDLVFGAMNSGIMGIAYKVAKQNNRKVIGIAPEIYKDDFKELDCDKEILTKNVSDRTDALVNNSDILMFLPGGVGTLYELMTAIEMKRSREFDKPIILCNDTGFFDDIIQMLDKIYAQNFTNSKVRLSYNVANDYMAVMDLLSRYRSINKGRDEERGIY